MCERECVYVHTYIEVSEGEVSTQTTSRKESKANKVLQYQVSKANKVL